MYQVLILKVDKKFTPKKKCLEENYCENLSLCSKIDI